MSSGLPPDAPTDVKSEYPKGWDQSGSLRAPKTHKEKWPWCKFQRTINVEVRTLDTWSRKHEPGPIDFIWADLSALLDLLPGFEIVKRDESDMLLRNSAMAGA
jgi:hypothetical protein